MRARTAGDARVMRVKEAATNEAAQFDARALAQDAYAVISALDSDVEKLHADVSAMERSQFDELERLEEEKELAVKAAGEVGLRWRAIVARILGLSAYDESILTPDDADAKLRGILR